MSYNQLRQTFPPPPEGDRGTVTRPVRQPQPRGATPSPLADGGLEGSAMSEEERSAQLSEALRQAGFVPNKVRTHFRMGLVVNMDGEVLDLERTQSIKHKLTLSRSSANPEVLFTEQLACCPHFTRRAVSSLQRLPGDWQADAAQITIRPRTYVQHLQQSGLKNSEPAADVDFSGLERALFCRVGEASGHLYMLLKYLLLRALPQALPDKIRPFTEVHCRQLLWYIISREHRNYIGDGESLLSRGRRGLQLMAELLEHQQQLQQRLQKGNSQRNVAFRNFFDQRLGVPFDEAVVGLVDRALLCRLLSNPTRLLTDQVDAYISRLRGLGNFSSGGGGGGGLSGSYFVFRPLLMTIPGCSSAAASRPTASQLAGLADYPMVGFRLYRALDILLDECRPDQGISAEFSALISSLRRCATTAAACLSCMMALKLRQGAGLAHQTLMQAGQISVTDCFETDCAWLYRCKLIKDEHEDHVTECHGPGGTAFLAAYPRIRCLFFPATQKPILHSQHCSFVYRLRINFVALWHSLNTQLASDLGSYIRPSYGASAGGGGPESKSQLTTRMLLDQPDSVMDPQEIVAQVLICSSSPSRRLLLSAFKALVTGAAPFHRERGRDEWRWLNLVRLHLMGTWLTELRTSSGGNRSQREDFCELVSWCNEYDELFYCSIAGCGVSAMLH
uniref:Mab-21 domain-containing protein n=1 Tax=Macrostomum lignano TaxID=282301 RepID=A0A1I8HBG9_9PLAT